MVFGGLWALVGAIGGKGLQALGLQGLVQAREYAAGVAFVDHVLFFSGQVLRGFDVALGVVVVVAGLRVNAAHGANHFAGEQDVLGGDHFGQQVDTGLVVHAGVEVDVVEQVLFEQGLFHLLRQTTETAPVVRHCAAAVGDQELQRGKVLEQIAGQALHEGGGVRSQVVRAGGVEAAVAAGGDVDHRGDVVLHHLFVDGVPARVRQRRRCPVAARRIGVQVDTDVAVLLHALDQLRNAGGRVHAGRLGQHG